MRHADPALSAAQRIDAACDRFESEWKAGRRPRIDAYLAAAPEADREQLRQTLLAVELELAGRAAAETTAGRSSVRADAGRDPVVTVEHGGDSKSTPEKVGRFEVRGVLGSGAFGKVYRAFDPQLGREVALKVPLEATVRTDAERTQFLKEARSAATINHPNVCQIYEVGEHGGRPYIVMALVPGQSLADALKARKEPLPEKQTALIVRKVALALAAAHDKGIVHRDLKPANVMFDRERKDVVVMDFGLARGPRLGDARATQSGVVLGTPAYMSPEQARGDSKDVGPAGDVFSLGVILYELLTGTRPFAGTATEVIGQILHVDPEPPAKRRPGIHPRLEAVCLKGMAKESAARFATMKEFAAALDAVLNAPPPAETARADAPRRQAEPAGTGTVAAVVAALSAEQHQARAETTAAVEAAIARHRTPRWVWVLAALLLVCVLAALGGIAYFGRSDKVTVTIELTGVDLADRSLSFFLDDERISGRALAEPIELSPGEHVLLVKRGNETVKRLLLTVAAGPNPGVRVRDATPSPGNEPPQWKDQQVVVWKGLELEKTLPHEALVSDAVFSADGTRLLTACYRGAADQPGCGVHTWDVKTWQRVGEPAVVVNVGRLALRQGRLVLGENGNGGLGAHSRAMIHVWDVAKKQRETTFPFDGNNPGAFISLELLPDGKHVLASWYNGDNNATALFDLATGEHRLKVKGFASCLANDGKTILVGEGAALKQIDIATGKVTRTLQKHSSAVVYVACSPDGRFAASSSQSPTNEIVLWDLAAPDGAPVLLGKQGAFAYCLAFSPNGKNLLSGSAQGVLKLWDVVERKEVVAVRADEEVVWSVRFSPDGTRAVTGGQAGKAAKVWKLTK